MLSATDRVRKPGLDELIEPAPLAHRLSPALADLGLSGSISWSEAGYVLDALEAYDQAREDLVHLVAVKRHEFYRKLGGTTLSVAAFRAKTRHYLATGEEL
jgi:hypothetical protein